TLTSAMGGRPMNPRQALDLAAQIADALAEAHAAGVFHRHLTPDAIVVTPRGHAKLLHVGLTSWLDAGRPDEAVRGDTDDGADIHALGALLFEMLTGVQPADVSPSSLNASVPHQAD